MKKDLYKWQKDCLREWEANHRRGIAHVVTGAGKTFHGSLTMRMIRRNCHEVIARMCEERR